MDSRDVWRRGKGCHISQYVRWPAKAGNHTLKPFRCRAGCKGAEQFVLGAVPVCCKAAGDQHFRAESDHDLMQSFLAPLAREVVDGFSHLHRITGTVAKRLIHVGDNGGGRQSGTGRSIND